MIVVNKEGITRNIDENQLPEYIRKGYIQVVNHEEEVKEILEAKVVEEKPVQVKAEPTKVSKIIARKKDTK